MDYSNLYIYPTDTVWGIGAAIDQKESVQLVTKVKGYKEPRPFSVLFSSIEQIMQYFDLPEKLSKEWLLRFFSMETTLGLPISSLRIEVGDWIYCDSHFIAIRCLENPCLSKMIEMAGAPVTTTSLNLKSSRPIVDIEEARAFAKGLAYSHFIECDLPLSGQSSTLLELNLNDLSAPIVHRPGRYIEKVLSHVRLLSA